ncbi:MAG: peptidylprolyl isomerase [Lentisphaeria bacterium]|nr:peptidylprolyl isomerase [Lentisphaeria bacterium]
MKVTKTMLALLALPMVAIATAQNAPVPTMAPGAKQIQAAPKTIAEALKFLPETVMIVNGKKVTKTDVINDLKKIVPEQIVGMLPPAQLKTMVMNVLDLRIMIALAEKDGFKPNAAAVKAKLQAELAKLTPDQKKMLEARVKAAKKTIPQFIDEIAKNPEAQKEYAIENWIAAKIMPSIKITDEDVLKFYNANKARFVTPEAIEASHILIQPEKPGDKASEAKAEAKAKAILAQLKQGADFGLLAQTESACPSGKRSKGALGKMSKENIDKDFWNAAFALKKGEISGVVKTQFGYHIIRLDNKTVATPIKFDELKNDIIEHLKGMAVNQKVKAAVDAAKKSGFVKISKF